VKYIWNALLLNSFRASNERQQEVLMDNPVFMIEARVLDNESATQIHLFLQDLTLAFKSCYYKQLLRQPRNKDPDDLGCYKDGQGDQEILDDEIPF
jgi:hypothetical protein